jgi:hypothetical protein
MTGKMFVVMIVHEREPGRRKYLCRQYAVATPDSDAAIAKLLADRPDVFHNGVAVQAAPIESGIAQLATFWYDVDQKDGLLAQGRSITEEERKLAARELSA